MNFDGILMSVIRTHVRGFHAASGFRQRNAAAHAAGESKARGYSLHTFPCRSAVSGCTVINTSI
jgi:hypothetical protein